MHDESHLLRRADRCHEQISAAEHELFSLIARIDAEGLWAKEGAYSTAHLLSMRYGISAWRAHRWVAAAKALGSLPALSRAFASGRLGSDKVCELARFATPRTVQALID